MLLWQWPMTKPTSPCLLDCDRGKEGMLGAGQLDGATLNQNRRRWIAAVARPVPCIEVVPPRLGLAATFDRVTGVQLAITPMGIHQPTIEGIYAPAWI